MVFPYVIAVSTSVIFAEWMGFKAILAFFGPFEEVLLEFLYNSLLRL